MWSKLPRNTAGMKNKLPRNMAWLKSKLSRNTAGMWSWQQIWYRKKMK